jgi:hypothetical protein
MNDSWVPVKIASVVEGDGDRLALPKLLHRIAADFGINLHTPKSPFRVPRSKLVSTGGIERAVRAQASEVTGAGGILVLFDADNDCPAKLGPQLAALPSLAGQFGFPNELPALDNPETRRDCKGRLTMARGQGLPYSPTADQAALASLFDMKMARENSPSFDKFYRDVAWLLGASSG